MANSCLGDNTLLESDIARKLRNISSIGAEVLSHLHKILPVDRLADPSEVIITLTAFANSDPYTQQPWTTPESSTTAQILLDDFLQHGRDFVTNSTSSPPATLNKILRVHLREVFKPAQSSSTLTKEGRPQQYAQPQVRFETGLFEDDSKPWLSSHTYVGETLLWLIRQFPIFPLEVPPASDASNETAINDAMSDSFRFFMIPILSYIEDSSPSIKALGGILLNALIERVPINYTRKECPLLSSKGNGYGPILLQALEPSLMLLPPSTSEPESLAVLEQFYTVYLSILDRAFYNEDGNSRIININALSSNLPTTTDENTTNPTLQLSQQHSASLTTLYTTFLHPSLSHLSPGHSLSALPTSPISTYPNLTTLLLETSGSLIAQLRTDSYILLRPLASMITSSILADVNFLEIISGCERPDEGVIRPFVTTIQLLLLLGRECWTAFSTNLENSVLRCLCEHWLCALQVEDEIKADIQRLEFGLNEDGNNAVDEEPDQGKDRLVLLARMRLARLVRREMKSVVLVIAVGKRSRGEGGKVGLETEKAEEGSWKDVVAAEERLGELLLPMVDLEK